MTKSEDELSIELVKGKLLDEDRRRKNAKEHTDKRDKAFKIQSKKFAKTTSQKQEMLHVFSRN